MLCRVCIFLNFARRKTNNMKLGIQQRPGSLQHPVCKLVFAEDKRILPQIACVRTPGSALSPCAADFFVFTPLLMLLAFTVKHIILIINI